MRGSTETSDALEQFDRDVRYFIATYAISMEFDHEASPEGASVEHARTSALYQRVHSTRVAEALLKLIEDGRDRCGRIGE